MPSDGSDRGASARNYSPNRNTCRNRLLAHLRGSGRRIVDGRGLDRRDLPAGEQAGEAADVVFVEMSQHHERQVRDVEALQARVFQPRIGTGVDRDGGRLARAQQEPITLPDVFPVKSARVAWSTSELPSPAWLQD